MKRCSIIALIVGICHVGVTLSKITTTTMNYTVPRIVLDDFFEDDKQLFTSPQVYGPCLGQLHGRDASCSLTLKPRRPTDASVGALTCDFNVSLPKDPARDCDVASSRAATIAKDKALLILSQGCVHNWYVLHFSNCTATPVKYNDDTSIRACTWGFFVQAPLKNASKVSPHKRLFDVMLDGPTRVMLGILPRFSENLYHYPLLPGSDLEGNAFLYTPTRGRIFLVLDAVWRQPDWGLRVLTVGDNGLNRTLKEYKFPTLTRIYTSAMYKLLTTCVGFNLTVMSCAQFDSDGNINFETHLPYVNGIYNLPGGGFNAITKKCLEDIDIEFCPVEKREFTVTKVDSTGSIVGFFKLPRFHCKGSPYINFFKTEIGELCFSQKCCQDYWHEPINLEIICFDDEYYVDAGSASRLIE